MTALTFEVLNRAKGADEPREPRAVLRRVECLRRSGRLVWRRQRTPRTRERRAQKARRQARETASVNAYGGPSRAPLARGTSVTGVCAACSLFAADWISSIILVGGTDVQGASIPIRGLYLHGAGRSAGLTGRYGCLALDLGSVKRRAARARARSRPRSGRRAARRAAARARARGRFPPAAQRRRSRLLELLEDPLVVVGRDARAGVGDRDLDLAARPARPDDDAPACGRELDRVREQVEHDLAQAPLVARDDVDVRAELERERRCRSASRARAPSRRRARASRAARTAPSSSSIWPASTFDRSRTSLIRESRWLPDERMSSRYSACFSLSSPKIRSLQHLREADDRVQRRPQLVRHVREELALVAARRLELAVQPPQLVVHPVHVRRERAELVAVRHVEAAREVPGGDLRQPRLRPLDRVDQRPREDKPSASASTTLPRRRR